MKVIGLAMAVVVVFGCARVRAELKVGDAAPDFALPGSDGKTYSLAQHRGPEDKNGGQTAELSRAHGSSSVMVKVR